MIHDMLEVKLQIRTMYADSLETLSGFVKPMWTMVGDWLGTGRGVAGT